MAPSSTAPQKIVLASHGCHAPAAKETASLALDVPPLQAFHVRKHLPQRAVLAVAVDDFSSDAYLNIAISHGLVPISGGPVPIGHRLILDVSDAHVIIPNISISHGLLCPLPFCQHAGRILRAAPAHSSRARLVASGSGATVLGPARTAVALPLPLAPGAALLGAPNALALWGRPASGKGVQEAAGIKGTRAGHAPLHKHAVLGCCDLGNQLLVLQRVQHVLGLGQVYQGLVGLPSCLRQCPWVALQKTSYCES